MATIGIERTIEFAASDGVSLRLTNMRNRPTRGPVLLVHGSGVRSNLFRPPVKESLVDVLVDNGWDVWNLDWRASIDYAPTQWTLDDAAVHDHPAAVARVLAETGASKLAAVVHCQGSTSFCMSAAAGLLPEVTHVVSSAVSLHPVLPRWSELKIRYLFPQAARFVDTMDSSWTSDSPEWFQRFFHRLVTLTHRECEVDECRLISEIYGAGFPALWRHEQLNDETHREFIPAEFGPVPMSFFRQMKASVIAGQMVSTGDYPNILPERFADQAPKTDAKFTFFTGTENRTFLSAAQTATHEWFDSHQPGRHRLALFPGYSHLDVFLGKNAAVDVFPTILEGLGDH